MPPKTNMSAEPTSDGIVDSFEQDIYLLQRAALVAHLQSDHNIKAEQIIIVEQGCEAEQPENDDSSVFYLYGDILPDGWSWGNNTTALREFLGNQDGGDITLRINSPGGILSAGVAMYNLLRDYPGKITAKVDGICASAATLPLIAAEDRLMGAGAQVMIHNPRGAVYGDSSDLKTMVKRLEQMNRAVAQMYSDRTTMAAGEIKKAMNAETFYNADEAIDAGLATGMFDGGDDDAIGDDTEMTAPDEDTQPSTLLQNVLDAELYLRDITRKTLEY